MAGGLGKRMNSDLPKVLHEVVIPNTTTKLPMIVQVISTASKLFPSPSKIFIIVGKYKNIIESTINSYPNIINLNLIEYVIQEEALGTGHAILCALPQIKQYKNEKALILSGDVPLISLETLDGLNYVNNRLLVTILENPYGCGRVIFDAFGQVLCIVEEKDCTEELKKIDVVNCGIYQINVNDLLNLIPQIKNNNKANEYYLTDIIGLMVFNHIPIDAYILPKTRLYEIKNVNTKQDLDELNELIINKKLT
jgi:bifunctional N-acetylglucosamine-1-phosphate-uridyltransferase/glucosamine-1-phosphate-acetyltransferase GlmU-like protein